MHNDWLKLTNQVTCSIQSLSFIPDGVITQYWSLFLTSTAGLQFDWFEFNGYYSKLIDWFDFSGY